MSETRKRILAEPPPKPTAAPAPAQATTGRKRILAEPPPKPSQAAPATAPTTVSTAPLETSLPPLPRPTVAPVAPPAAEPPAAPAPIADTGPPPLEHNPEYAPQPQDAYEMSASNARDWQGQLAAGFLDATVASIPATVQLGQGILSNWTRPMESYPEEVSRETGWNKAGFNGALDRFAYNTTHQADDDERWTEKARRGIYNFDTEVGEYVANGVSPVSLVAMGQQAWTNAYTGEGPGGGWQEFERDPQADRGEVGFVAPAKEILPDIATAAIPLPGTKLKAAGYITDMIAEAPVLFDKGMKMADNVLEWFIPFSMPGTKGNMAINAGVTGAIDEAERDLSGAETMTAPIVEPIMRVKNGVTSSGISGYDDAWTEPSNEGYVP